MVLVVDLGFGRALKINARLWGIQTPDPRRSQHALAIWGRLFLSDEVLSRTVTVRVHRDRRGLDQQWLVELWDDQGSINDRMVERGYARRVEYK